MSKSIKFIGNELHAKDSFEFLIHDIKHMEHFTDEDKYTEQVKFPVHTYYIIYESKYGLQVGFFHSMLKVNKGSLKAFFTKSLYPSDIVLWHALEYVISDM